MTRPVFKPSPTISNSRLSYNRLDRKLTIPMIQEVTDHEALELDNFPVIAVTTDGVSPNQCDKK